MYLHPDADAGAAALHARLTTSTNNNSKSSSSPSVANDPMVAMLKNVLEEMMNQKEGQGTNIRRSYGEN